MGLDGNFYSICTQLGLGRRIGAGVYRHEQGQQQQEEVGRQEVQAAGDAIEEITEAWRISNANLWSVVSEDTNLFIRVPRN